MFQARLATRLESQVIVTWFSAEIFIGWFRFMYMFIRIFNDTCCMFFKANPTQAKETYRTWKSSNLSKTWPRMETRKLFVNRWNTTSAATRFSDQVRHQNGGGGDVIPDPQPQIRLFYKLWKVPTAMENSHMLEYVIEINFIPKIPLTRPD